jgi:hypothetical protein
MKRTNKFLGIILDYETVFTYYKNSKYPDFDHFVFQQMIDDNCEQEGSNFSLAAYAVNADFSVLNGGKQLPKKELDKPGVPGTKKGIQFANMKLDNIALAYLYKSSKSRLFVHPVGPPIEYYPDTSYVQYVAETTDAVDHLVIASKKIDPSPPA